MIKIHGVNKHPLQIQESDPEDVRGAGSSGGFLSSSTAAAPAQNESGELDLVELLAEENQEQAFLEVAKHHRHLLELNSVSRALFVAMNMPGNEELRPKELTEWLSQKGLADVPISYACFSPTTTAEASRQRKDFVNATIGKVEYGSPLVPAEINIDTLLTGPLRKFGGRAEEFGSKGSFESLGELGVIVPHSSSGNFFRALNEAVVQYFDLAANDPLGEKTFALEEALFDLDLGDIGLKDSKLGAIFAGLISDCGLDLNLSESMTLMGIQSDLLTSFSREDLLESDLYNQIGLPYGISLSNPPSVAHEFVFGAPVDQGMCPHPIDLSNDLVTSIRAKLDLGPLTELLDKLLAG